MKKIIIAVCLMLVSITSVYAADRTVMETQIMEWSQERLAELEKTNRVGPIAEWKAHIQDNDYEWLAVSLIVHHALDKRINETLKGNRNAPKLAEKIQRDKTRLVVLGEYVVVVNR